MQYNKISYTFWSDKFPLTFQENFAKFKKIGRFPYFSKEIVPKSGTLPNFLGELAAMSYYKILTSYVINLQSVNKSFFKTAVCSASFCILCVKKKFKSQESNPYPFFPHKKPWKFSSWQL